MSFTHWGGIITPVWIIGWTCKNIGKQFIYYVNINYFVKSHNQQCLGQYRVIVYKVTGISKKIVSELGVFAVLSVFSFTAVTAIDTIFFFFQFKWNIWLNVQLDSILIT